MSTRSICTRMRHISLLVALTLFARTTTALLIGNVAPGLQLINFHLQMGEQIHKFQQVHSVQSDAPESVITELGMGKTWCREHYNDKEIESHISMLYHQESKLLVYSVLYRQSVLPTDNVVTLCAILCMHTNRELDLSVLDVHKLLALYCKSKGLFLQSQELNLWQGSRIKTLIQLEKDLL